MTSTSYLTRDMANITYKRLRIGSRRYLYLYVAAITAADDSLTTLMNARRSPK